MATGVISRYGLTAICAATSKTFLSLKPRVATSGTGARAREYVALLNVFDYLCNLNGRDRALANEGLSILHHGALPGSFPAIFHGLAAWGDGRLSDARAHFAEHLDRHAHDYVALFMLHLFDFLHGKSDCYESYLCADSRCEDERFGGYYQGMLAFALCERGQVEAGLATALAACDRGDPDDIYTVHALIHCWHALGEHEQIVDYLESRRTWWEANPGMNIHIGWHLAISLLAIGRTAESGHAYGQLRAYSAGHHAEQDLDAVNYCIRRYLALAPDPAFLREVRDLARNWAPSIYNSLSYFNDAHAACAFLLAGDRALMRKLVERPKIASLAPETVNAGQAILDAINSLMNGDHTDCVQRLEDTRGDWFRIGGSVAQREIFDNLIAVATMMNERQRPQLELP